MGKSNRKSKPSFVMLRFDMIDSEAWRSLSPPARSTWIEVCRRFNGNNNGEIPLSCREVSARCRISKSTASKAFDELLDKGFLKVGVDAGFNVKKRVSRRWIITHQDLNGKPPTNEWRQFI